MAGIRAEVRAELVATIKRLATAQLEREGPSGLSLRAIARDLDMVSSAIYRYFPGRDELLTALVIDAYEELGAAGETAEQQEERDDLAARWLAACRGARRWAHANPARYALIFGSPVPGYRAPEDTIGPATRFTSVLIGILADGLARGLIAPDDGGNLPIAVRADLAATATRSGIDVPAGNLGSGIAAWVQLFGLISFELFGHFEKVIAERDPWFDQQIRTQGALLGLPQTTDVPADGSTG